MAQFGWAIELRQLNGVLHGYPAMLDLNGKELGNGEFTQEVRGQLLRTEISYDLLNGHHIVEKAAFQQRPELVQKEWSWQELQGKTLLRRYAVEFDSGKATARKRERNELRTWSEQLGIDPGQTFAGFGFTLALQNLRDRLRNGEVVSLKAIGFMPKPRVVTVKLKYYGLDRMRMSGRVLRSEHFMVRAEVPAIAKLFVKISDTNIWLTPPPSSFLRYEGPLAEPTEGVIRVDLTSGKESGAAKPVDKH
jgi:hypothetical protein